MKSVKCHKTCLTDHTQSISHHIMSLSLVINILMPSGVKTYTHGRMHAHTHTDTQHRQTLTHTDTLTCEQKRFQETRSVHLV